MQHSRIVSIGIAASLFAITGIERGRASEMTPVVSPVIAEILTTSTVSPNEDSQAATAAQAAVPPIPTSAAQQSLSKGPDGKLPVPAPQSRMTLREACALSLLRSPVLAAYSHEIRAADARKMQAALLPNPEFSVETENLHPKVGTGDSPVRETTVSLSQTVELAGQRGNRIRSALFEKDLAGWDYEAKRLDVLTETARAYVDLVAAQERLKLAQEMSALAKELTDVTAKRVEAGKVSPVEQSKANVFLATRKMAEARSKGDVATARRTLAAQWGAQQAEFSEAAGLLDTAGRVPSLESLAAHLRSNPDLARWSAEIALRRSRLSQARSERLPAVQIGGGVKVEDESDNRSYLLGMSIPLPLWDQNQGAVREARANLDKAQAEREAAEVVLARDLTLAHQTLQTMQAEAQTAEKEVLPQAQQALDAARTGYEQGKLGQLDLFDAERTLVEVREQRLGALAEHSGSRYTNLTRFKDKGVNNETVAIIRDCFVRGVSFSSYVPC